MHTVKLPEHHLVMSAVTWRVEITSELTEWLNQNISGEYQLVRIGNIFQKNYNDFDVDIRFELKEDADFFKLTWIFTNG